MNSKKYYDSISDWISSAQFSLTDELKKKLRFEEKNGMILMSFDNYI